MTPRVTFGMIVLNGEPFLEANLKSIYPFAHQIIVSEGASPNAAESADSNGHSRDRTLLILREFKEKSDPLNKLQIVTAEDEGHPNGFWPGEKSQQSQAYAKRATGDWLWQVDVDEFYEPEDMRKIQEFLILNPDTSCIVFPAYHFWGGFNHVVEGGFMWHPRYQGEPYGRYRRVFKWQPGWHYATHRPPTIYNEDLKDITRTKLVDAARVLNKRRVMYHYFMTDVRTILRKARYYEKLSPSVFENRESRCSALVDELTIGRALRIFDQFKTWNWLEEFRGQHVCAIRQLLSNNPKLTSEGLPKRELQCILRSRKYRFAVSVLRIVESILSVARAFQFKSIQLILSLVRATPKRLRSLLPARIARHADNASTLDSWEKLLVVRMREMRRSNKASTRDV